MHKSLVEPQWDFWNQFSSATLGRSLGELKNKKEMLTKRQEKIIALIEQILASRGAQNLNAQFHLRSTSNSSRLRIRSTHGPS